MRKINFASALFLLVLITISAQHVFADETYSVPNINDVVELFEMTPVKRVEFLNSKGFKKDKNYSSALVEVFVKRYGDKAFSKSVRVTNGLKTLSISASFLKDPNSLFTNLDDYLTDGELSKHRFSIKKEISHKGDDYQISLGSVDSSSNISITNSMASYSTSKELANIMPLYCKCLVLYKDKARRKELEECSKELNSEKNKELQSELLRYQKHYRKEYDQAKEKMCK